MKIDNKVNTSLLLVVLFVGIYRLYYEADWISGLTMFGIFVFSSVFGWFFRELKDVKELKENKK